MFLIQSVNSHYTKWSVSSGCVFSPKQTDFFKEIAVVLNPGSNNIYRQWYLEKQSVTHASQRQDQCTRTNEYYYSLPCPQRAFGICLPVLFTNHTCTVDVCLWFKLFVLTRHSGTYSIFLRLCRGRVFYQWQHSSEEKDRRQALLVEKTKRRCIKQLEIKLTIKKK